MKARTATWFETKIRYDKTTEEGLQKAVTEQYVVDALTFGEAERTLLDEMSVYVSGECKITAISPAAYHEVFFSEKDSDDRWYKAKLQFITLDEATGKEKRATTTYLVQAASLAGAVHNLEEVMGGTSIDFQTVSLVETHIMDVFEHHASKETVEESQQPIME